MAQGWAGNQQPTAKLKCALCLRNGRSIDAVTQVSGTLVCQEHVDWLPLPTNPPLSHTDG